VLEVDALDELEETVHEVLARLLAVGDDVDARRLLLLQPEQRRVALGAGELGALGAPRWPQLVGLSESVGLRQAAGDGRLEHGGSPCHDSTAGRHFFSLWPARSGLPPGTGVECPLRALVARAKEKKWGN